MRKVRLHEIKIQSFVTQIPSAKKAQARGGMENPTCVNPCSDFNGPCVAGLQ